MNVNVIDICFAIVRFPETFWPCLNILRTLTEPMAVIV